MISRIILVLGVVAAAFVLATDEEDWKELEQIKQNLQPFGKVCLEGQDCGVAAPVYIVGQPTGTGLSGKGVYDKFCFACHEQGVQEAPLVASEAWAPRVEQGMDVLLRHTKDGFNETMPPMGTCVQCTDSELEAAINYLITGQEE